MTSSRRHERTNAAAGVEHHGSPVWALLALVELVLWRAAAPRHQPPTDQMKLLGDIDRSPTLRRSRRS